MPVIKLGHPEPTWFHGLLKYLPPWINDFTLTTVFIVLLLSTLAWLGTRSLRKRGISRGQAVWELIVQALTDFVCGIMGPEGRKHVPLIGTLFIFILTMNMFGIIPGFVSPTASLNTTIAMALFVFVYVQIQGIKAHGIGAYLKHFWGEPLWLGPLMFPLHMIGELAKPLSLALRLAGNVFAEDSVILIFAFLSPTLFMILKSQWAQEIPLFPVQIIILPLMLFFGLIQALVFSMLSTIYITLLASSETEGHSGH
jgi:F-type H+-transporting ATPase subunit a